LGKLTRSTIKETIDHATGEVLHEEKSKTIQLPNEPPYVKLYLDDLMKLKDLPKGSSTVLYELIKRINYDGQLIINGSLKRMIAKDIGIQENSISNAITKFIKKDIMSRLDKGIYVFNPNLFAKGSWTDIRKLRNKYLELTITYNKTGGKSLKTKIIDD
jgi:hypothetical protein